jgi:carboxyl-terminal processing protease
MAHRSTVAWIAIFVVIGIMFLRLPPMVAKQDAVLHTYGALVEVDALVKQQFVERVETDRLVDGAIRGVLLQLDPYSGYIPADELPGFDRRSRGDYCGLGVEIGVHHGHMTVIAPVEGSPAARAGVRPGDLLLAVDGRNVDGRSVFDVEEMLVGPPDSRVELRVLHPGDAEPTDIEIARGRVTLASVRGFARPPVPSGSARWSYLIAPDARIAYVRVSSFRRNTLSEFDEALAVLGTADLRGLVLDLRFNPGGHMYQAIAMVDRFISEGIILSTVNRYGAVDEYLATEAVHLQGVPIVVLVNGGSASAAEIVAGALQAHRRAVVAGERTFGKGSVQHVIALKEHQAAVKLTVAYYRLPDGRIIHRAARSGDARPWGITPDVPVTLTDGETAAVRRCRHELDLAFTEDGRAGEALPATNCAVTRRVLVDRQLERALELLRSPADAGTGP